MSSASTGPKSLASWPSYSDAEIDAVRAVLASGKVNYWTGEQGRKFEQEYADYVGVAHAIVLSNGSVALELALRALEIQPGDEVIVTSRSFIASASSIVLCGAAPVFADVDADSQNVTAETIAAKITPSTRAIILVHLAGWPCDMEPILELAEQHDLKVIEDCAQAHGARYQGRPVGSFGHMAAFSFCQDKIMTTGGEGGLLVTNSEALWNRAWSYKDHGKSHAAVYCGDQDSGSAFRWVHESFGSNFRMTEMQAAIGRIQLGLLDDWVRRRRANAHILIEQLADLPALRIPVPDERTYHAYYKFYVFVAPDALHPDWSRDRIIDAVRARNVPCFGGSCSEIYREKAFVDSAFRQPSPLPVAHELGDTSLMFLVHPTLNNADMLHMSSVIRDVVQSAQARQ